MLQYIFNIYNCFKYTRLLNDTMYQDNPITIKELSSWIWNYGPERTSYDLKNAWDQHNFYDQETL